MGAPQYVKMLTYPNPNPNPSPSPNPNPNPNPNQVPSDFGGMLDRLPRDVWEVGRTF